MEEKEEIEAGQVIVGDKLFVEGKGLREVRHIVTENGALKTFIFTDAANDDDDFPQRSPKRC